VGGGWFAVWRLFALRAGCLTENVFLGHAARLSSPFGRCSLWACGPRFFPLQTLLFPGPAARLPSPSGHCSLWACGPGFFPLRAFCLRRGTFCSPKKFLKNGSLRWPCGALRITSDPLRSFPQFACIGGGRGGSVLKQETPQPCHLWPPRKICLTRNPLGATRNSLEKHPSLATLLGLSSSAPISEGRGTLCETWGVSALLSAFNLVSSTRGFQTAHMPTLHYLMSIHELTESKVKLTLQRYYIAAC